MLTVTCPGADTSDSSRYIIVMTDPDAPSREDPKWSEFCHWIAKVPAGGVLQADLKEVAEEKHQSMLEHKRVAKEDEIISCSYSFSPPIPIPIPCLRYQNIDLVNRYGTRTTTKDRQTPLRLRPPARRRLKAQRTKREEDMGDGQASTWCPPVGTGSGIKGRGREFLLCGE